MNKTLALALVAIVGLGIATAAPAPAEDALLVLDLENDLYVTEDGRVFEETGQEAGLQTTGGCHIDGYEEDGITPIWHCWDADTDVLA
ncbi:MAG TPA: hypothetical protein VM889_02790 [Candidatus Thermoplasmatota archaeon]|nr:hypothetical protein [Candidatus Thermoplasmatota archaeon]